MLPGLPPRPWVVAHRGDSAHALENTLEAILGAAAAGADLVEVDVQLTRDGELVVFHDPTLERLAGDPRRVEGSDWSELAEMELGAVVGDRRLTGRIPRLIEVLEALPEGFPLNVEVKRYGAVERAGLVRFLRAAAAASPRVLVSSFDLELLAELREDWPEGALAPISRDDPETLLAAGDRLAAAALHAHRRLAPALLGRRHDRPLLFYTVNDPAEAGALWAAGAAGVFADDPAALLPEAQRRRAGGSP